MIEYGADNSIFLNEKQNIPILKYKMFFVFVMFVRNRRLAFFKALAPSLLFFVIYSVAAGAYEGNMGTAFRHKSLILWVMILLLASTIVATKERKAEKRELSS